MATTMSNSPPVTFELSDVVTAVNTVVTILRRAGYRDVTRKALNRKKHWLVMGISPNTGMTQRFYVKWEDRLFDKAGKGFVPELVGTKGGLTINVEYAETAYKLRCMILFAQKVDGMIYEVNGEYFWENSYDYPHMLEDETVRCIGIESVIPWKLGQQHAGAVQVQQQVSNKKPEEMIMLLRCLDCGYAKIQSKQDVNGIELKLLGWGNEAGHSQTFGHRMEITRISRSDPVALKLRDRLQRWEKW